MARILIIDDDPELLAAVLLLLERRGHETVRAENGKLGLAVFKRQAFDLVVTDCVMPEMEGIELIQAMRSHTPAVKIIAMSGGGSVDAADYLRIARSIGAAGVIAKPFTNEELTETVDMMLGSQI